MPEAIKHPLHMDFKITVELGRFILRHDGHTCESAAATVRAAKPGRIAERNGSKARINAGSSIRLRPPITRCDFVESLADWETERVLSPIYSIAAFMPAMNPWVVHRPSPCWLKPPADSPAQ
jgi:hypothetical protein